MLQLIFWQDMIQQYVCYRSQSWWLTHKQDGKNLQNHITDCS